MSKNNREYFENKVRGAIYGFAIGDAMGATTEFMDAREIHKRYGVVEDIIGGGWLKLKPGQVTDDTEMMLCVVDAYKDSVTTGADFSREVAKRFIDWYIKGPVDCGNACKNGICRLMDGRKPRMDKRALGNGALMRALPMALVDHLSLNWIQTDMTHYNRVQHHFVAEYHNMVIRQVYGTRCGKDIGWRPDGNYSNLVEPTGHVANTLWKVVWHMEMNDSLEGVIVDAVNDGGDADTIAAIAGGLAGAKWGWQNVPKRWVEQLDFGVKRQLDAAVDFITDCCLERHIGV